MWLAIDGYNVIADMTGESLGRLDLENEREQLNQLLIQYRSVSKNRVTVVYDGARMASGEPRQYSEKGVKILFSSLGRSADQVLVQMAQQYGSGLTVVTSDREVADRSQNSGAVVIASGDFCQRLLMVLEGDEEGFDDAEPEIRRERHLTDKKGNPRKLSKKERQRNRRLGSI